jgi:transposase
VPALPSSVLERLWVQVAALLPVRRVHHPLGCHRPADPDRLVFDKLIQVLVFGCGYRRIADHTCSATTLRRRRDEWIHAGVVEHLRLAVLDAYQRLFGLDPDHLAVDGCIAKAPCGGQVAGPSPGRPSQAGLETLGRHRRRRHPAGRGPRSGQPPRRRAARGDPGHPGSGQHRDREAARRAGGAPGRRLRLPDLPAGAGRPRVAIWPAMPRAASTGPGHPPLAGGAHPCVGQPIRQAALGHRAPPDRGPVLAGALAGAAIVLGRLIRRAWTSYRWDGRPRRRP